MAIRKALKQLILGSPPARRAVVPSPLATPATQPTTESAPNASTSDQTPVLALYKYDACPYCRRVMRTIDALGIAGQIEFRDTRTEPKWRQDLIAQTGRTQVPCLFIDGKPMFESADISRWLEEQFR